MLECTLYPLGLEGLNFELWTSEPRPSVCCSNWCRVRTSQNCS